MRVSPEVLDEMRRRGRVTLRIGANRGVDELVDSGVAAIRGMRDEWSENPPLIKDTGVWLSDPAVYFAVVPPDLILSVAEVSDADETYSRLIAALEVALPEEAQIDTVNLVRGPARERRLALLELRIAVEAVLIDNVWDVRPSAVEMVNDLATSWLMDTGPQATFQLALANGEMLIRADQLPSTLREQRRLAHSCRVTALAEHWVRTVNISYRSAHVSIVCGRDVAGGPFDWKPPLDELISALAQLEPIARSAFVRHSTDPEALGRHAHGDRRLDKIANRRHVSAHAERALEESGLVDAHGIVFVAAEPDALPPGWTSRPFGHLRRIDAPNLAEWFAQAPSERTLQAGRAALKLLLQEPMR